MDACVYLKESTRQRALPTCCFQDISTRLLAGRVYLSALSLHIRSTDVQLQRKKKKEKNERMRLSTALGISSSGQVVCCGRCYFFTSSTQPHGNPWSYLRNLSLKARQSGRFAFLTLGLKKFVTLQRSCYDLLREKVICSRSHRQNVTWRSPR